MKNTKIIISILISILSLLILSSCDIVIEFENDEDLKFIENYGGMNYSVSGIGKNQNEEIIIPDTYKGKPVTIIKADAFNDCHSITSVVIPDSIKTIGARAFKNCINLEKVTLSNNIEFLYEETFYGCKSLKEIEIPNSVKIIENSVFEDCIKLEKAIISNGLEYLYSDVKSLLIAATSSLVFLSQSKKISNSPHAIFLGTLSKSSQNIIVDYFTGRGGNTKAYFKKIKISIDSIINEIEEIISGEEADRFVINCTSTRPEVLLALGKFIDRIPILQYDKVKGLISFKTGEMLCSGLENKNFAVQEYIQLCKGEVINASSGSSLNKSDFNALVVLYKDAMKQRQYTKITHEDGNQKEAKVKYIPWNLICKFFENSYKGTKTKFSKKEFDAPTEYSNIFSETVFLNCRIGTFLSSLLEYRMIGDLTITTHGISDRQLSFNRVRWCIYVYQTD